MQGTVATAPGKIILFGEHAVVYRQPAIAVPVQAINTRAVVRPGEAGLGIQIIAANLGRTITVFPELHENEHALATAARKLLVYLDLPVPDLQVLLHSTIPIASGLGSGAAATTALLRGIAKYLQREIALDALNNIVYAIEQIYHGTPSGIDNTVIVYGQPVYFVRDEPIQTFSVGQPAQILIADSGIPSPTHVAVGDVRKLYDADMPKISTIISRIGEIVNAARAALAEGDILMLGALMGENHACLRDLTVSSPALDALVAAAVAAGAYGAKLSGGGRGGNVIALVDESTIPAVLRALYDAGAKRIFETTLE